MFEFELLRIRSTELRRQAAQERLAREAVRGRREARRDAARGPAGTETHTDRPRRHGFARAA